METRVMVVTPEMASRWLEYNGQNRPLVNARVARYAADMKAGRWELTHQGLAFEKPEGAADQVLLDGQHRLWAVVDSGATVQMQVAFGVKLEGRKHFDRSSRTLTDAAILEYGKDVGPLHIPVAKYMRFKSSSAQATDALVLEEYERHREAVAFAIAGIGRNVRGIRVVPVLAVIARAYYHVDRSKLARFCELLASGEGARPEEGAAIMLRNWLLESSIRSSGRNTMYSTRAKYDKTARAVLLYMRGERPSRIISAERELFPLPGERVELTGPKPRRAPAGAGPWRVEGVTR